MRVPIEEDEITSSEESDTEDETTYSNSQVAREPTPVIVGRGKIMMGFLRVITRSSK